MSHGARAHLMLSRLVLFNWTSPTTGASSLTRALKSPHTIECCEEGTSDRISSTKLHASPSVMPFLTRFIAGGKYTFVTQQCTPPASCSCKPCAYSLPTTLHTLMPFLTIVAMPPLLPWLRLCSKILYPGSESATEDYCSHVSYIHNTSKSCISKTKNILNKLMPAILILPILTPYFTHLSSLHFFSFLRLFEPLLRLLLLAS